MAEGTEFLIELTAKLDEAAAMVRELRKVEAAVTRTDTVMKKGEKQIGFFGRAMGGAKSAFASFGTATMGHLTALATFDGLKALGHRIMNLGEEAIRAAAEAQRTRASFRLLLGEKPADELLSFLDRLAKKTEFTDGQLKDLSGELIKAGFSGEQFNDALAATIDMAALTKSGLQGANEAVGLFSRVKLRGNVGERDLIRVGLDPKKLYARLASDLGIGQKQVKERLQENKIETGVLLAAINSEIVAKTGKPLAGAGFDMGKLLGAQLTHAKDIIPNLFEELEGSAGLESLTAGLAKMNEMLDPSSAIGKRVVAGLDNLLGRFGKLVSEIDFEVWAGRIEKAFDYIGDAMEVAAGVANALGATFEFVTGMSAEMGESLYNLTAAVGGAAAKFFEWGIGIGKALWEGLQNALVAGITAVVDTVGKVGSAIVVKFKSVLGIHSPSSVFGEFGFQTAAGFSLGIAAAIPGVQETMERAFAPMSLLPVVAAAGPAAVLPELAAAAPMAALGMGLSAAAAMEPDTMAPLGLGAGRPITTVVSAGNGGGQAGPHLEAHVTVNLAPGSADENVARQAGEYSKLGVLEALESLLSQLAAEGGAA